MSIIRPKDWVYLGRAGAGVVQTFTESMDKFCLELSTAGYFCPGFRKNYMNAKNMILSTVKLAVKPLPLRDCIKGLIEFPPDSRCRLHQDDEANAPRGCVKLRAIFCPWREKTFLKADESTTLVSSMDTENKETPLCSRTRWNKSWSTRLCYQNGMSCKEDGAG